MGAKRKKSWGEDFFQLKKEAKTIVRQIFIKTRPKRVNFGRSLKRHGTEIENQKSEFNQGNVISSDDLKQPCMLTLNV